VEKVFFQMDDGREVERSRHCIYSHAASGSSHEVPGENEKQSCRSHAHADQSGEITCL
jgi:hypothetical protein